MDRRYGPISSDPKDGRIGKLGSELVSIAISTNVNGYDHRWKIKQTCKQLEYEILNTLWEVTG
jgi:hypothetical protein